MAKRTAKKTASSAATAAAPAPLYRFAMVASDRHWSPAVVNEALSAELSRPDAAKYVALRMPNLSRLVTVAETERLVALMEANPMCAALSVAILDGHAHSKATPTSPNYRPVPFVELAFVVFRTDAIKSVGVLNEAFEYGWGADIDLSMRLRRAHYEVAVTESVAVSRNGGVVDYGMPQAKYLAAAEASMIQVLTENYGADGYAELQNGFPNAHFEWAWKKKRP